MNKIPDRYSYTECYLTLKCNFKCSYCINGNCNRSRAALSAREWCLALNNLETKLPITLGGGEPTIHAEFYDIIAGLKPELKIDLLTNGSYFDVLEFMERIKPERFSSTAPEYKSIRISFHPTQTDQEKVVAVARTLAENGYSVGIFGLNHPANLKANVKMTERCRSAGVFFFIRDFLGFVEDRLYGYYKYLSALNGNRKRCKCKTEELLVGPDGNVFRCHRDLYDGGAPIGNLLNMAYQTKDEFLPCENYGLCNFCDIKNKMSPNLSDSKCAVIIEAE